MKSFIILCSALVFVAARPDVSSLTLAKDPGSENGHTPYHYIPPPPPEPPTNSYLPPKTKIGDDTPNGNGHITDSVPTTEDPLAEPPNYSFRYDVKEEKDDLEFGHQEQREGDNTQGKYYVLHPDGRLMTVVYTVTKDGGYMPVITFDEPRPGFPRPPKTKKTNGDDHHPGY